MKYLSVYKPYILSLGGDETVNGLRIALYEQLQKVETSSPVQKQDFFYSPRIPHKPTDIRLFRFTGRGQYEESLEWTHEMDYLTTNQKWREDWILWRAMHSLGRGHFDVQCGNELSEDALIRNVLQFGPVGISDLKEGEVFVYYDVCEDLLDNHEQLYVNVITDDEYQEITIQVDDHCTCESVLAAVDNLPRYHGYEKYCFCMEHGLLAVEEESLSIVRYGVKYQTVSQLCVQCIARHPTNGIKCYGCVINRWKKDGRPGYSNQNIPRIFFVCGDDTYEWIQKYLASVFHLEEERTVLMYLNGYTRAFAPRRDWVVIESMKEKISDNPVEGLLEMEQEEWLHSPVFCLYRPDYEQSEKWITPLHISHVYFTNSSHNTNYSLVFSRND